MWAAIWPTSSLSAPKTPRRVGDAGDHVVDESPRQPVKRAVPRLIGGANDAQRAVLALEAHLRVELTLERAERSLHREAVAVLRDLHSVGERNRHASDS